MNTTQQIAAVVVTFFPDDRVTARLAAIRTQVDRLVVVDNGSPAETQTMLETWAEANGAAVLANAENRGLGKALNQGMSWSEAAGSEWAVTFDQDSMPQPGMVAALLATAQSVPNRDRVAMVGANTYDERTGAGGHWLRPKRRGFRLAACSNVDLDDVTFVITSGILTRVRAWRELGGFDEGLFIDYLDHDLCLKARMAGLSACVSAGARLAHNFGASREVVVAGRKLRPTFHSAGRHYYMARNRVLMWRRYAWRYPHWWLFDLCFGLLNTFRVIVAEDQRWGKLSAILRGTFHGLLGRSGPMTPAASRAEDPSQSQ
jgi:rhamnosyltransferase